MTEDVNVRGHVPTGVLLFLAFIEGFASLGIEITALRRLVPYLGSSITITAPTIGCFLAALALGYWSAGRVDTGYLARLERNFLISALLAGIGLSSAGVSILFVVASNITVAYILFMALIVCPTAYLLAQTVPLITNMMNTERHGAASGQVLACSTVGSVVGASALPLAVMPIYGVAAAGLTCSVALIAGAFTIAVGVRSADRQTMRFGPLALAVLVATVTVGLVRALPGPAGLETEYADYAVVVGGGPDQHQAASTRWLIVNHQLASRIDDADPPETAEYVREIQRILRADFAFRGKRVLVLGAGGFTVSLGDADNEYVYVDVDPAIKDFAEREFLKEAVNGRFVAQDARRFMLEQKQTFDAVIVDVYSSHASIPSHLITKEFWELSASAVTQDGLLIINVITEPSLRSAYATTTLRTIESVAGRCAVDVLKPASRTTSNVVVLCRPWLSKATAAGPVYTDEVNQVDHDRGILGF